VQPIIFGLAAIFAVVAVISFAFGGRDDSSASAPPPEFDPFAGGHPVPPLPGQEFTVTRRAKATVAGTTVASTVEAADAQDAGVDA